MLRNLLQSILYQIARWVISRRKPFVVAITGSVGKTSTKEAVYAVLQSAGSGPNSVRRTLENFNNEIGVPLTILGTTSGGKNPFKWLWIFVKGIALGLLPLRYPDTLVLEMGADKPGDITYLTGLAPANIGIITAITETPAHLQAFKDVAHVAKEKLVMLTHLGKQQLAIVNLDEPYVAEALPKLKSKTFTISTKDTSADLTAIEIDYAKDPAKIAYTPAVAGIRFKVQVQGSIVPVFIPGAVGAPTIYSALFAIAVGLQKGMNLVQITKALQQYRGPNGRLRLLPGIHHSVILDDTYNSSPAAAREALAILHELSTPGKKVVALGVMAELGSSAKRSHIAIGKQLAKLEIDTLIAVGEEGQWIAEAAKESGFPEQNIQLYGSVEAAAANVPMQLAPNDIMLVKGSQVARMEKLVKASLADPATADDVLVRQYGKWKAL